MPRRPTSIVERGAAPIRAGSPGWRIALAAGALLLGSVQAFAAGGLLDLLFGIGHDVQVITATDMTPAGALLPPASPEHPVYFLAVSAGYRDLGGYMAGDKLPAPQNMIREVMRVLAKQGYLPADSEHRPTQCIIFAWGTLYPVTMPNPNPDWPDFQLNGTSMMRFLGGSKLGLVSDQPEPGLDTTLLPGLTRFNPKAEAIASVSRDYLYAIKLASYEFPVARPNRPKLLWRTKISWPSRGLVMAETLPTMMSIAGPYIGRDTKAPVWVNASDKFKPEVRIGNPKVEEYLDSAEVPIFDAQAVTANTNRHGK